MSNLYRSLVLTTVLFGAQAFAEEKSENHPCKNIHAACTAAGFTKGDHKNKKGLMKDCMKPIMEGQTVPGVTVAAGEVEACKAKKAEHQAHKK